MFCIYCTVYFYILTLPIGLAEKNVYTAIIVYNALVCNEIFFNNYNGELKRSDFHFSVKKSKLINFQQAKEL